VCKNSNGARDVDIVTGAIDWGLAALLVIAVHQFVVAAARFFDQLKGDKADDGGEDGDKEKDKKGQHAISAAVGRLSAGLLNAPQRKVSPPSRRVVDAIKL
jgi:hypothetical protein